MSPESFVDPNLPISFDTSANTLFRAGVSNLAYSRLGLPAGESLRECDGDLGDGGVRPSRGVGFMMIAMCEGSHLGWTKFHTGTPAPKKQKNDQERKLKQRVTLAIHIERQPYFAGRCV